MKGIKRKCRLVVIVLLTYGVASTKIEITEHSSIVAAKRKLAARKTLCEIGQKKIIHSEITPID